MLANPSNKEERLEFTAILEYVTFLKTKMNSTTHLLHSAD